MKTKIEKKAKLEIKNLKTHFFTKRGVVKAVDGIDFYVAEGETVGIVGESGSGKSITCLSIMRLVPPPAGRIVDGRVILSGENILLKTEKEMRKIRGKRMSMILQNPMTSLNPVFTIGSQVTEPIRLHQGLDKKKALEKAERILSLVKISSPEVRMGEYPHQMSGGMRQRIVGAMALGCEPELLIADEPTTALDVTIQAQFLKLLKTIQQESKFSMIMVTHDLGIVAKVCDRAVVMYAGKIVESAKIKDLFDEPFHPYTIALLKSLPRMKDKVSRLYSIQGQPPNLLDLKSGCSFEPRCPHSLQICQEKFPSQSFVSSGHTVSCWLAEPEKDCQ